MEVLVARASDQIGRVKPTTVDDKNICHGLASSGLAEFAVSNNREGFQATTM
jgi:hypothetical protein